MPEPGNVLILTIDDCPGYRIVRVYDRPNAG